MKVIAVYKRTMAKSGFPGKAFQTEFMPVPWMTDEKPWRFLWVPDDWSVADTKENFSVVDGSGKCHRISELLYGFASSRIKVTKTEEGP